MHCNMLIFGRALNSENLHQIVSQISLTILQDSWRQQTALSEAEESTRLNPPATAPEEETECTQRKEE